MPSNSTTNVGLFSPIGDVVLLPRSPVAKGGAAYAAPTLPPIQAPKLVANWDRFFNLVDDTRATGEEVVWEIANFLYGKKATTLRVFLEMGGKFPLYREDLEPITDMIKEVCNRQFGQNFTLTWDYSETA